jgi:hypothetical protein
VGTSALTASQVPPASLPQGVSADWITSVAFASIGPLMPLLPNPEISMMIAVDQLTQANLAMAIGEVHLISQQRQTEIAKSASAAKTAADKLAKVSHHSKFWSVFKTVVEVALTAVATVFGGPLGTMAIVGLCCALAADADELVKDATGHGVAGLLYLAENPGDEAGAAKADMAFELTLTAVALVCAWRAGSAATKVSDATKLGDAAKVSDATKTAQTFIKDAKFATAMVTAAGDTYEGVENYRSAGFQADAERAQADGKIADATGERLAAISDRIIQDAFQRSNQLLDTIAELEKTLSERATAVSHVTFTA